MKNAVLCLLFSNLFLHSHIQRLQLVPRAGFQYHGLSYISRGDNHPSDFTESVPRFVITMGADVKYKASQLTHVVSLQSIALGPSFSFTNRYFDKGIVPSSSGHHMAASIDHALLSYGLERESKADSWAKFNYSLQVGWGFNKSKKVFDSTFTPDSYGSVYGTNYEGYYIKYQRTGMGLFLSGKAGVNFYSRRNKPVLNLQVFWHQGLLKMAEFDLLYRYGYFDYPQYQKEERVKFKTRGTVFGVTLGVPIRFLKEKPSPKKYDQGS